MRDSNTLFPPLSVSTPNGTYNVNRITTVDLKLPGGKVTTRALVNPRMKSHLIYPLPIIQQKGPIIMTEKNVVVLPHDNDVTRIALAAATPIALVNNGLYELLIPPTTTINKPRSNSFGATTKVDRRKGKYHTTQTKSKPRTVHVKASIPTKRIRQAIGLSTAPSRVKMRKCDIANKNDRPLYDYHLLLNHASPRQILKTINNPNIMLDPSTVPHPHNTPFTCQPCRYAKQKSAPHYRTTHIYAPGQAISSGVAGPINVDGKRIDEAYFVTCLDAASRYSLCIPIVYRTMILPFIEESIIQFISVFNRPASIFVSYNAREYISTDMKKLLQDFNIQHQPSTPYQPQDNSLAERLNQTLLNAVRAAIYTADLTPSY